MMMEIWINLIPFDWMKHGGPNIYKYHESFFVVQPIFLIGWNALYNI